MRQQQGRPARQHVHGQHQQHRVDQPLHLQQCQQAELEQQHQQQCDRAVGAQPRILHDAQRRLAVCTAAQCIAHIGQPVLVKGAGQQYGRHGREQRRHERHQQPDGIMRRNG